MSHPAQFSKPIIDALRIELEGANKTVFDPFAGLGVRLGELCDELGVPFLGIDIEDWPGRDKRVWLGDATNLISYPYDDFIIVSSPTYPNGISDHFKSNDKSKRFTYRSALGKDLQENNTGRYSIRGGQKKWDKYWELVSKCVDCWSAKKADAYINIKGFIHKGELVDLPKLWKDLLSQRGYDIVKEIEIPCPGIRMGANREARLDNEVILVGKFVGA